MDIRTSLNYLRVAPRKVRLITKLITDMDVKKAERKLQFLNKRAAKPILKLLNSAVANAKNNFNLNEKKIESLHIKKIIVDEGPKLKRFRPVSRGRAHPIQKKTSNITLVLEDLEEKNQDKKDEVKNKI